MAEGRAARAALATAEGVLVVDKPAGITSHDVVAACRRSLRERRVGHAGTLDPGATGVLVLGVGRATRLLRFAGDLEKAYTGEVVLGTTTSSLDADGEVTGRFEMAGVTLEAVRAAASGLTGSILQVPPMVSAVRVGGKRLYQLAREGVEIERAPRPVTVKEFDVTPGPEPHVYRIAVTCSSGTFVRVLAADLGAALGGGAHLRGLRRTAIGPFGVDSSIALADVYRTRLRPTADLVAHLDAVEVAGDAEVAVGHGRVLARRELGAGGEGPWAVLDAVGELIAVYEGVGPERAKPMLVLRPAGGSAPAE